MTRATIKQTTRYPTRVFWDRSLVGYNFGSYHPMQPSRLDATYRLLHDLKVDSGENVSLEKPEVASDDALKTAHTSEYVEKVKDLSRNPDQEMPDIGLGTEDTPAYEGIHEASARLAGGTLQAAEALLSGEAVRAVNFSGGMHHAFADRASGFCVYNDCAVAILRLLEGGVKRVLYVDVDGHHGDGTQSIFWDDERVMTISIHETGLALFPGTGFANEIGGSSAAGTSINVALPPETRDADWLRAFESVVPQMVRAFQPEVIVSQHGCDSHKQDQLTHLQISVDAQRQIALETARLADEVCEGRWIATGGGGYDCHDVVPRSWTHLVAVAVGAPVDLDTPVPASWRQYMAETYGAERVPESMGDDADLWWRSWEAGFDPNNDTDRSIMATRKEVFPQWGLDPWYD